MPCVEDDADVDAVEDVDRVGDNAAPLRLLAPRATRPLSRGDVRLPGANRAATAREEDPANGEEAPPFSRPPAPPAVLGTRAAAARRLSCMTLRNDAAGHGGITAGCFRSVKEGSTTPDSSAMYLVRVPPPARVAVRNIFRVAAALERCGNGGGVAVGDGREARGRCAGSASVGGAAVCLFAK